MIDTNELSKQPSSTNEDSIDNLFTPDLRVEASPQTLKKKLEDMNITSISQLIEIEAADLTGYGITVNDALSLINCARKKYSREVVNAISYNDVPSWLKANGLEQYIPNFSRVPFKMLPFLRRSDLTNYLGIPVNDISKVWDALAQLPKELPPPLTPIDDACEVICTSSHSPFNVTVNEENFLKLLSSANKKSSAIKVALLGDTGTGKSLVISQLLKFEDRICNARGPLIASRGQIESTTGNVCFYQTESKEPKYTFLLLDFEGAYGSLPAALRRRLDNVATTHDDHNFLTDFESDVVMEMTKERENVVKVIFPQLAYLISNIVILLDRNPPHHTGYAEKLKRFTEASTRNAGAGEKPFLIVVQNPVELSLLKDPVESFLIEKSTEDFYQCLQNQNVIDELKQYYRDICFIRLPFWDSHPIRFDQQILQLEKKLTEYANIIMTNSWYVRNFWSDYLWLQYVKNLCLEFKKNSTQENELNVSKILSTLIQPGSSPFQRILNFWHFVWTPPTPGKQKVALKQQQQQHQQQQQQQQTPLEQEWAVCYNITFERFADVVLETIQSKLNSTLIPEHVDRENIGEMISDAITYFNNEISKYAPCIYRLRNGNLCGIAREWHTTGHYGEKEFGVHLGPTLATHSLLCNKLKLNLKTLTTLNPMTRAQKSIELLRQGLERKTPKERREREHLWTPFCMICLRNFTRDRKVKLLRCSHVICGACWDFAFKLECPIHINVPLDYIDFQTKIPQMAGVRILSLDGGNGIRGVVECKILEQIEMRTGYKICQLFDLIMGSGVGGFLALATALKKDPVREFTNLFLEYTQTFSKKSDLLRKKLSFFRKYKYSSQPLKMLMQNIFGEMRLHNRCVVDPTTPLVAVTAMKRGVTSLWPALFANYVHSAGLEDCKELNGQRQIIHDCFVWKAAVITLSTPPFLRPLRVEDSQFFDGSFAAPNPSIHALSEAQHLWDSPIDCLISVGSGFSSSTTPKVDSDTKLIWDSHTVDVVTVMKNDVTQCVLECIQKGIYFERLNPELPISYPLDQTSPKDIQTLTDIVNDYLVKNAPQLRAVCRCLLSSLLYVAEVTRPKISGEAWKIHVHCRERYFNFTHYVAKQCQLVANCLEGEINFFVSYLSKDTNRCQSPVGSNNCFAVVEVVVLTLPQATIQLLLVFDGADKYFISGGKQITLKISDSIGQSVSHSSKMTFASPVTKLQTTQNLPTEQSTQTSNVTFASPITKLQTNQNLPTEQSTQTSNVTSASPITKLQTTQNLPTEQSTQTSNVTFASPITKVQTNQNLPTEQSTKTSNVTSANIETTTLRNQSPPRVTFEERWLRKQRITNLQTNERRFTLIEREPPSSREMTMTVNSTSNSTNGKSNNLSTAVSNTNTSNVTTSPCDYDISQPQHSSK
jgi:hypothetical protein